MPNWCETTYRCVGDPKTVRTLHEAITKLCNEDENRKHRSPLDWDSLWIGKVVEHFGGDPNSMHCRGEIIYAALEDDDTLELYQMTAWGEQTEFRHFLEEKFPDIKVYYQDIEPGNVVYCTNSFDCFPERYILEWNDGREMFDTLEDAAEYIEQLTGCDVAADTEAIISVLKDFEKEREGAFYYFNEFEEIEN